ncbi:MAG: alpha/beta hydrolase [Pseudomonadales bacterium]|nr:alpha/beta hydrolase [Pseudomonadales bacterium]
MIDPAPQPKSPLTLVLAHGAGAPMDSDFMAAMAAGISQRGITVARFEFPYMEQRRLTGKKSPPNRMPVLLEHFAAAVEQCGGPGHCVVGGKSMGGRVASVLLAKMNLPGAVSLGYPFHPPGKPDRLRADHWPDIRAPWLIVQGTRDPFGKPQQVADYPLPPSARVRWLEDGDHDFKPRKASGLTQAQHWEQACDWVAEFVAELPEGLA